MYKQRLNPDSRYSSFLLALFFALITSSAFALSTDKQQDIEIEADVAEMDDIKGITSYRGNVVMTQGSIRMTGHTMTVHFTGNDIELVIMQGNPATYRQLPDDSEIYDQAQALQMEYHALKNLAILIDEAVVTQKDLRFSGNRIEYNTVLSQIKIKSSGQTDKSRTSIDKKGKDDRVKITIKKKR